MKVLIISVDRMERGKGEKSALAQIREEFGFKTCAIVTMAEVREYLLNRGKKNSNKKMAH